MDWDFMKVGTNKDFKFSNDYHYEIKWDGIRCMVQAGKGKIFLYSKNKVNITNRFPEVQDALLRLKDQDFVIDGELVVLRSNGRPDFLDVMKRFNLSNPIRIKQSRKTMKAKFIAFDLIYDNGNIQSESLEDRYQRLTNRFDGIDRNRAEVNSRFEDGQAL